MPRPLSALAWGVAAAVSLLAVVASGRAASQPPTLVAVGDVAGCETDGDEAVAALVARMPGTLAILGDAVYEHGSAKEFRDCWQPTWGRFAPRIRAALGNHDYGTGDADAAIAVFRLPGKGWYAYRLGAWRVIVLNSNCDAVGGCGPDTPQWKWLRRELVDHRHRCTVAYWHHPRWSSTRRGPNTAVDPLWRLLADARADLVLAGHDHVYERFAPIDGIRSFVVGTGGRSHHEIASVDPRSRRAKTTTFGVLRLTLFPGRYDWRFVPVAGGSFTDAGSGRCR